MYSHLASSILLLLNILLQYASGGRLVSSANIETLKLANVIFRHGSRSPITSYYKDPYNSSLYWHDGPGQLTNEGKLQEYELGQYLRWRYMKFVETTYHANEVYVQSSDIDRTIMSAELVLAGLFPPEAGQTWNPNLNWQPIPVHTVPIPSDNLIAFAVSCPHLEKIFHDFLESPEMDPINDKYRYMYKYLSDHAKRNITNVLAATDLYDVLYIQELHNLTLPDWVHNYYPEKLKAASEDAWVNLVPTREIKRLRGGPLVGDFMLNVERFVQEDSRRKYRNPKAKLYLYSGHDSTLATFLGLLGVFDRQIPPYSSAAFFELHKEKDTNEKPGEYFIEIYFRNDTSRAPFKLEIPLCGQPCKLDDFKRLFHDVIIYDWRTWQYECQLKPKFLSTAVTEAFFSDLDAIGVLMLISVFSLGFILSGIVFVTLILPFQRKKIIRDKESFGSYSTSADSKEPPRHSIFNNNYKHNLA